MNLLKKIDHVESLGVFDAYKWNCKQEFGKQNLFFGFNGSGKTTLSSLFNLLNTESNFSKDQKEKLFNDLKTKNGASFKVADNTKKSLSYPPIQGQNNVKTFIFNSNFIADHVFDGQSSKLQIFNVSETVLENPDIKKIDNEIEEQATQKSNLQKRTDKLEEDFSTLKTKWNKKFRKAFPNQSLKIGTSIPSLTSLSASKIDELKSELSIKINEYELTKKQEELEGDILNISPLNFKMIDFDFENFEDLLSSTVKNNTVSVLKERLEKFQAKVAEEDFKNVEPWYKFGYTLFKNILESEEKKCPLCNSDLEDTYDALISDFADQFDKEYESLVNQIKAYKESIKENEQAILRNSENAQNLFSLYEKYSQYLDKDSNFPDLKKLGISLTSLSQSLEKKEGSTSQPVIVEFNDLKERLKIYNGLLQELNNLKKILETRLNGIRVDPKKLESSIRKLYQDIVFIELNEDDKKRIESYHTNKAKIEKVDTRVTALTQEKAELLNKLKIEANRVNQYLSKLGIHHFSIDLNKDQETENILIKYQNQDAYKHKLRNTLSEGEKTALAFSYFLSKISVEVKDYTKINIVIDDPISSLDDNRLYSTAYIISEEFKSANQLFVLSHNLLFLKYLNPLLKAEKSTFIVSKGKISDLPDSIKNFQSPYFYMLEDLIKFRDDTSDNKYEEARKYLPNYVRRVLETYLCFKFAKVVAVKGKNRTPGLPDFIDNYIDYQILPQEPKGEVNRDNLKEVLSNINKQCDNFSHGSSQQLDECNFMSEDTLMTIVTDTIDVLDFLDGKHLEKAIELMGLQSANDDAPESVSKPLTTELA